MYSDQTITNPDKRTTQISGTGYQSSAVRIDDSKVSVRNTWSSEKINEIFYATARVESRTMAEWAKIPNYIPKKGTICVYSDRTYVSGEPVPAIKIADGLAYICDQPYISGGDAAEVLVKLDEHIRDETAHVSADDRLNWNNKVSAVEEDGVLYLRI